MTDDVVHTPMQTPLLGMDMDSDTAHYVGILEGTIAALVINECKYRALLEMLTGESWEDTKLDIKGKVIQQLAISALVKQTGMDPTRAKLLVAQRWDTRNQEAPTIVPVAVPTATLTNSVDQPTQQTATSTTDATSQPDMRSRAQAWKERQLADAAAVDVPEP
jgi:hypothetical protein